LGVDGKKGGVLGARRGEALALLLRVRDARFRLGDDHGEVLADIALALLASTACPAQQSMPE
jgi:hypothetical protein